MSNLLVAMNLHACENGRYRARVMVCAVLGVENGYVGSSLIVKDFVSESGFPVYES
jgi:hypothetical protein